jgi:hypothetical protein
VLASTDNLSALNCSDLKDYKKKGKLLTQVHYKMIKVSLQQILALVGSLNIKVS